jgi:hypothetical protein
MLAAAGLNWNAREEFNGRAAKIWERADETDPGTNCEDTPSQPHATTTPYDPSPPRVSAAHVCSVCLCLSTVAQLYDICFPPSFYKLINQ